MFFVNKKILLVGFGVSTKSVLRFFHKNRSYNVTLYLYNDTQIDLSNNILQGVEIIKDIDLNNLKSLEFDYALLSPSVHIEHDPHIIVQSLRILGVTIISDLDIMYEILQKRKDVIIFGITGTNGKSTTVMLLYHILKQFFGDLVCYGGNIGVPALDMDLVNARYYVLELSSYQLTLTNNLKLDYGCLLNISSDHLEYHGTMDCYVEAKEKIIQIANKSFICIDHDNLNTLYQLKYKHSPNIIPFSIEKILQHGVSYVDSVVYKNAVNTSRELILHSKIKGRHNLENILACIALCLEFKLDIATAYKAIATFSGLEHRAELVCKIGRVSFINDSKATNSLATDKMLEALPENAAVCLIAGGIYKNDGGFDNISKKNLKKIKHLFLIGKDVTALYNSAFANQLQCTILGKMEAAIETIYQKYHNNTEEIFALLSPMCASQDQYQNFEHRGKHFKELVSKLAITIAKG